MENKDERKWFWFLAKGNRPSKTAFWLFCVMSITVLMLAVIVFRFAFLPNELFVSALTGGAAFFGLINFLVGLLYHQGKNKNESNN